MCRIVWLLAFLACISADQGTRTESSDTPKSRLARLLMSLNPTSGFSASPGAYLRMSVGGRLRGSAVPNRWRAGVALASDMGKGLSDVDMKKLRLFVARQKAFEDNSTAALQELSAAEDALFDAELMDPSSVTSAAKGKVSQTDWLEDEFLTGNMYMVEENEELFLEFLDRWNLNRLAEENERIRAAEKIMMDLKKEDSDDFDMDDDDGLEVRDAVVELGKSMFKGNLRAEYVLLDVLAKMAGTELAPLVDSTLRNGWTMNELAFKVSKKLAQARGYLREDRTRAALQIYDGLCNQTEPAWSDATPMWPEAWRLRAMCQSKLGEREEALKSYETALAFNPRCYPIMVEYVMIAMSRDEKADDSQLSKRKQRSRELLDNALSLNPGLRLQVESLIEKHAL